jgi:hypothetical protein
MGFAGMEPGAPLLLQVLRKASRDTAIQASAQSREPSLLGPFGHSENARKYSRTRLTIGTTINRPSHDEYPAFLNMKQNGRMISAEKNTIINGPKKGHIDVSCIM